MAVKVLGNEPMIDKRKALKESAAENQKLVDRGAILSQKAADAAQAFKDYAEGAYRVAQLSGQITEEDEKQHVQLKANAEEASRQASESQGVAKQAADNLEQQKGKLIEQTGITDERRRYEEHVNQLLKERVPLIQDESLGARDRRETQQFGAPLTDYGRLQQQIKRLSDLGDRRDLTPAEESAARDAYVNSVKELRDRQIQAEKMLAMPVQRRSENVTKVLRRRSPASRS